MEHLRRILPRVKPLIGGLDFYLNDSKIVCHYVGFMCKHFKVYVIASSNMLRSYCGITSLFSTRPLIPEPKKDCMTNRIKLLYNMGKMTHLGKIDSSAAPFEELICTALQMGNTKFIAEMFENAKFLPTRKMILFAICWRHYRIIDMFLQISINQIFPKIPEVCRSIELMLKFRDGRFYRIPWEKNPKPSIKMLSTFKALFILEKAISSRRAKVENYYNSKEGITLVSSSATWEIYNTINVPTFMFDRTHLKIQKNCFEIAPHKPEYYYASLFAYDTTRVKDFPVMRYIEHRVFRSMEMFPSLFEKEAPDRKDRYKILVDTFCKKMN